MIETQTPKRPTRDATSPDHVRRALADPTLAAALDALEPLRDECARNAWRGRLPIWLAVAAGALAAVWVGAAR